MKRLLPFLLALAIGCATRPSSPPVTAPAPPPDFHLVGSRIIACCCATPCPCRLNKPPAHCHGCDSTTAVHVGQGRLDGVDMAGVTWILTGRAFGEKKEENWLYGYVDEAVSDAQYKALEDFLADGMKDLEERKKADHVAGKFLGMRRVAMAYAISSDGRDWSASIPGVLTLRTRSIVLPGHLEPVRSTGIFDDFGDSFIHADCLEHVYRDSTTGYAWDLTGRQCNQAPFELTSERIAKGGIGWGCWNAHREFGSRDRYTEQILQEDEKPKQSPLLR